MRSPHFFHIFVLNVFLSGSLSILSAKESIKINTEIPSPGVEWSCQRLTITTTKSKYLNPGVLLLESFGES